MANQPALKQFRYRTARGRLDYYKAYAAWHSASPQLGATDWRAVRNYLYAPYSARASQFVTITRDSDHGALLFADNFNTLGWRDIGDAYDVARSAESRAIEHTGWYADSYQSALIRGHVLQLPARNGECQYVPATYCNDWDGVTVYLDEICDDKLDAAKRADGIAEMEAEKCREQDAQYCADLEIEAKREEIIFARRECLKLLREMRPLRKRGEDVPTICRTLRAGVAHYLDDIREARERIAALTEDYWLAVENY